MIVRSILAWAVLATCTGSAAAAHPHVFIDAAFELVFNETGQLAAVRVNWSYDAFYSLMLIEENGLDADGDGLAEQAALDAFAGRDVDWEAGFPGDFTIEIDGKTIELERPVQHAARMEGDSVVTSHLRPIATPIEVAGQAVVARAYDPSYFVAYDLPTDPTITGREDCELVRKRTDIAEAQETYGARLAEIDAAADPFAEIDLPDIGILFADSFALRCAASS